MVLLSAREIILISGTNHHILRNTVKHTHTNRAFSNRWVFPPSEEKGKEEILLFYKKMIFIFLPRIRKVLVVRLPPKKSESNSYYIAI